jgi:N-acylglucosamine 2-epimerase
MLTALLSMSACVPDGPYAAWAHRTARAITGGLLRGRPSRMVENALPDWTYQPLPTRDRIDVGHNLKGAWALAETYLLTGDPDLLGAARSLLDFCLRSAWDTCYGAFYRYVYRRGPSGPRAQGVVDPVRGDPGPGAALGPRTAPRDEETLHRLVGFCMAHFADPVHGEWFAACDPDGTVRDERKGLKWKGPYHTVRVGYYGQRYLDPGFRASPVRD